MSARSIVLLTCLALASAGPVRREAPPSSSVLDDVQKHAAEFQKTVSEQLSAITSSKNTEELTKAFKDGSDSVVAQISTFSASLQGLLGEAQGKAKEALESSRAALERSAEELRRAHPEVEQQAQGLKDRLQQAVQSVAQETEKLAKEVSANIDQTNQKLAPQLKAAFDDFVKQAQDVQKKVHDAANKQ